MKRKLILANEELEFKMTNKTVFDLDEKYNNFGKVINGVMYSENLYNNSLRVLECSCITKRFDSENKEKELTTSELIEKLTPSQVTKEIVPLATQIYLDYMGVKKSENNTNQEEEVNKKN